MRKNEVLPMDTFGDNPPVFPDIGCIIAKTEADIQTIKWRLTISAMSCKDSMINAGKFPKRWELIE